MSSPLVDHSPDLVRLIEDEYDIEIRGADLLVHHVPFVTAAGTVSYGILVSELSTNGESTIRPGDHKIWLVGGVPHDHQGGKLSLVINEEAHDCGHELIASCQMSGKLKDEYPPDYYIKVSTYVNSLEMYSKAADPSATHKNYPIRETSTEESVFRYHDAATSRAGISAVTAKLRQGRLAIVGLGGTGAYILDLVAKTPVEEIHLFDGDELYAHNAFRSPGAASIEQLRGSPKKVDYLAQQYDVIRRAIIPHPIMINAENVDQLREMSFVFLAIDSGPAKRLVIEKLREWEIPFIDCGMNVRRQENSLRGMLRATAADHGHYDHLASRVSFDDVNDDEYDSNIQTGDLNMMNAAMAVIKWKKLWGYYVDTKRELGSTYTVARNQMTNGELDEAI